MGATLELARLMLSGSQCRAQAVYDLLSTRNTLGEGSLYLNLGYWEKARTYDEACTALADLLGEAAGLGPSDELLDVGFGFADQDMRWIERFSPRRIVGLNITASQVEVARRRVAERGLSGRIELLCGSATNMPFGAGSFDKVTALETAFHYDTREAFFREAFRVLRPGGRLAVADILPLCDPASLSWYERLGVRLGRQFWQIPEENVYTLGVYEEKLRRIGFHEVRSFSIRDQVFLPFARYALQRLREPEVAAKLDTVIRLLWKASVRGMGEDSPMDYTIVTAEVK